MTDILKLIPPMLTGAELHQALAVNPEYDPAIRYASAAERLMGLNTLYEVYFPFSMISSTIYSKMVLSMIRGLQKKTGKLAVRPCKWIESELSHSCNRRKSMSEVLIQTKNALDSGCRLQRMQTSERWHSCDFLVDLRIIFHSAASERIESGIHTEVHL